MFAFDFSFDAIKEQIQQTLDSPRTFETIGNSLTNAAAVAFRRNDDSNAIARRSPQTPVNEAQRNYAQGATDAATSGGFNLPGDAMPLIAIAAIGFLVWKFS